MSNKELYGMRVGDSAKPYGMVDADNKRADTAVTVDPAFVERMQQCAERAGSVNALARKAELSQSGIRRYFSGGEPTRKVLIAIANAADVDFLWLATGEGSMLRAEREQPTPPAPSRLDINALQLAIETVEESLSDTGRQLPLDRKADMVIAAYELFLDGRGKIEKSVVLRLVKSAT